LKMVDIEKPTKRTLPFTVPLFSSFSAGLTYTLNDDGNSYAVSDTAHTLTDNFVVIPESFEGKPVTKNRCRGILGAVVGERRRHSENHRVHW